MDETKVNEPIPAKNGTDVKRQSERELVITRTFDSPAHLVFEAWTKPELLMRWWAPKSFGITFLSCEADVRTGGTYRFVFGHPASDQPMAFFGRYIEVTPHTRLVWTNEESDDGAVTTVTFAEKAARRFWFFPTSIPPRTLSTRQSPPTARALLPNSSRSWTRFWPRSAPARRGDNGAESLVSPAAPQKRTSTPSWPLQ